VALVELFLPEALLVTFSWDMFLQASPQETLLQPEVLEELVAPAELEELEEQMP